MLGFLKKFRWNKISDEGLKALAEALESNSSVTSISLSNNYIGYEGLKVLAEAIKVNSFLTKIDLEFRFEVDVYAQLEKNRKIQDLITKVKELNNQKNYDEAFKIYDEIIEFSSNPMFYYQKELAYKKIEKYFNAYETIIKAIDRNPNNSEFEDFLKNNYQIDQLKLFEQILLLSKNIKNYTIDKENSEESLIKRFEDYFNFIDKNSYKEKLFQEIIDQADKIQNIDSIHKISKKIAMLEIREDQIDEDILNKIIKIFESTVDVEDNAEQFQSFKETTDYNLHDISGLFKGLTIESDIDMTGLTQLNTDYNNN